MSQNTCFRTPLYPCPARPFEPAQSCSTNPVGLLLCAATLNGGFRLASGSSSPATEPTGLSHRVRRSSSLHSAVGGHVPALCSPPHGRPWIKVHLPAGRATARTRSGAGAPAEAGPRTQRAGQPSFVRQDVKPSEDLTSRAVCRHCREDARCRTSSASSRCSSVAAVGHRSASASVARSSKIVSAYRAGFLEMASVKLVYFRCRAGWPRVMRPLLYAEGTPA